MSPGVVGVGGQAALLNLASEDLTGIGMTLIAGSTISGRISLPGDDVAPAGGLDIQVSNLQGAWANARIEAGQKWADYVLVVPAGEHRVQYYIHNSDSSYLQSGFFGGAQTVNSYDSAVVLDTTGSNQVADMTLLPAVFIRGTISLPSGNAVADLQVQICNNSGTSVTVTIPAGQNSAQYNLPVGPNTTHTINYLLSAEGPQYIGLVRRGYFSDSGTTTFREQVSTVASGATGVDLVIQLGQNISGTIALPEDYKIPLQGVQVSVYVSRDNEHAHSHRLWLTTSATTPFAITVPEGTGYKVWYSVTAPGLVAQSYYVGSGVVGSWYQAARFDVIGQDVRDIAMTLITGKVISGTVSLPDGFAPAGGLRVHISNTQSAWVNITILSGQSSANYTLVVPEALHRVQYNIFTPQSTYLRHGYYAGAETVNNYDEAILVDTTVADEVTNIDLEIIRAVLVKGNVSLPSGVASSDMPVQVSNNDGASVNVTIVAGQKSAPYELPVASNTLHTIRYRLAGSEQRGFVGEGFYGNTGTVTVYHQATKFYVGSSGADDINLTLRTGSAITGILSLPSGIVAPPGGLRIQVNNSDGLSTMVTIPANANRTTYHFVVPDGQYRISYWISDWDYRGTEFVRQGYYSVAGTTAVHNNATVISVSGDDAAGIDFAVLMGSTISGVVRLPGGMYAPTGGIPLHISNNEGASSSVNIPAGENSAPYTLTVTPGQYRVRYHIYDSHSGTSLIRQGYYGGAGYHGATLVDVAAGSVTGIDLSIATGVVISGAVSLPAGVSPGQDVRVQVSNDDGAWASVTLRAGASQANYNLTVPPGMAHRVRYHISTYDFAGGDFVRDGYYHASGTTASYHEATLLQSDSNLSNVNMTLLMPQVRGTVLTADGSPTRHGWVQLQRVDGWQVASTGSSQDGKFSFGGLPVGDYKLRAYPDPGSASSPSQDYNFSVAAGPVQDITVYLSSVQFKVHAHQAPRGWVEISRIDGDHWNWHSGISLNHLGEGFVGGLSDGTYQLRVYPINSGDISPSVPEIVVVSNGIVAFDTLTVNMQQPQIYGVLMLPNGQVSPGGWIQLMDSTGRFIMGAGVDRSGHFALAGLDPELDYSLRAYPDNRTNYTPSNTVSVTTETESSVESRIVLTLTAAQIFGTVYHPNESPVSTGWVEVRNASNIWITSVGVDRKGAYRIGGLPDGNYVVQAMAPGSADYANSNAESVVVSGEAVLVNLTMRVPALTGHIVVPLELEASTVWVEVGDELERWLFTVAVDSNGNFRLPMLDFSDDKTYTIQAFASGFQSDVLSITPDTSAIEIALNALAFSPLSTAETGLGGNPLKPALVSASITSVALSATSHIAGTSAPLRATVSTANVINGTQITCRLVRQDLSPIDGLEFAGTIQDNQSTLDFVLPDTLAGGSYLVMVSIPALGLTDPATGYSVVKPAEPAIIDTRSSHSTGNVGTAQELTIDVSTAAIDNGSVVKIRLQGSEDLVALGVDSETVISNNGAQSTLSIPDSLSAGVYRIKVEVAGLTDTSLIYTVLEAGEENEPPQASTVHVTGVAQVGNTLTGNYDYSDHENDLEGMSSYKWYRSDTALSEKTLVGSSRIYTLTAQDQGKYMWFEVEPMASAGTLKGLPVLSAAAGPVSAPSSGVSLIRGKIACPLGYLGGVTVTLWQGADKIAEDTTTAGGVYEIGALPPGDNYRLTFVKVAYVFVADIGITLMDGVEHNMDEVAMALLGDVNLDGFVNAADIVPTNRHALGIEPITNPLRLSAADSNGDGFVNAADIVPINRHALGIELMK